MRPSLPQGATCIFNHSITIGFFYSDYPHSHHSAVLSSPFQLTSQPTILKPPFNHHDLFSEYFSQPLTQLLPYHAIPLPQHHQAGFVSKALELAFQTKQFAALHTISESFDQSTEPLVLQRCANFFVTNSQFDRAVDLLASANKVARTHLFHDLIFILFLLTYFFSFFFIILPIFAITSFFRSQLFLKLRIC